MKHWFERRKRNLVIISLLLLVGVGVTFAVGEVWRMIQIGDDMVFFHGTNTNPTQKAIITPDGALGIGTTPQGNVMLALEDDERAILINRVTDLSDIASPVDGMMVYHAGSNCFRFRQGGAWTDCLGVAKSVRIFPSAIPDSDGYVGNIYFNDAVDKLFIHDGTRFVHLAQPLVKTGDTLPPVANATTGDIFFNTTNNRLYVFNGTTWIDVSNDFSSLMSYQANCTVKLLPSGQRDLTCPGNKIITSILFEAAVGKNQTDNLSPPEVRGVECCEVTFDPYYWSTGDWSACTLPAGNSCGEGTQNRSVSCLKADGSAASTDGLCILSHKPIESRTCVDTPCTSWVPTGNCIASNNSSVNGIQEVQCEDQFGTVVPDSQCTTAKPQNSCTIPGPSNDLECGADGWLDHGRAKPQPHSNAGTTKPYGSGSMTIDWSRCSQQEYIDGAHSVTNTISFINPPRSGRLRFHVEHNRVGESSGGSLRYWFNNAQISSGHPYDSSIGGGGIRHTYFQCDYAPNPSGPDYTCTTYTP